MAETDASNKKESKKPRPKKGKPGFHNDMFQETQFYFKKGLRYVYPYPFTFTSYIKKRWLGLKVLELFQKEFHMETVEYYKAAIKTGKIQVNDEVVSEDKVLTHNEILKTTVHRHEPPVIHEDIEFLRNDDEMVVINKPSSIPVHPCGRYRHNTVVFILGKDHGLDKLHTIHRIDRLTSGILMFAKTPNTAREMEQAVHGRNVEKEYLARVVGEFPSDEVTVDEPILTASHKIGVCHVNKDGKPCKTVFTRLSYNGKSSLVKCRPLTGRMHQIRVHLRWLGFPIVNDPIYNHPTAWNFKDGQHSYDIDKVINELVRTRKDNSYDSGINTDKPFAATTDVSLSEPNLSSSHSPVRKTSSEEDVSGPANKKRKTESTPLADLNFKSVVQCVDRNISENIKVVDESTTGCVEICTRDDNIVSPMINDVKTATSENTTVNSKKNELVTHTTVDTEESERVTHTTLDTEVNERVTYTTLDIGEKYYNKDCTECKRKWKEPFKYELVMYLHALRYKGPDWEYKTSIPTWAKDDWIEE